MTSLQIEPTTALNFIVLVIQIIVFVFMYQKKIKNTVDSEDLDKLKNYVDSQDRAIHHRIDGIEKKTSEDIAHIRTMTQEIYNHLLK